MLVLVLVLWCAAHVRRVESSRDRLAGAHLRCFAVEPWGGCPLSVDGDVRRSVMIK